MVIIYKIKKQHLIHVSIKIIHPHNRAVGSKQETKCNFPNRITKKETDFINPICCTCILLCDYCFQE